MDNEKSAQDLGISIDLVYYSDPDGLAGILMDVPINKTPGVHP